MQEKLLSIIEYHGVNTQERKLEEEVFEFQEAVIKFENGVGDIKDIIEEITDVTVLLDQFRLYYQIEQDEEHEVYEYKVNNHCQEIEKEKLEALKINK